MNKRSIPSVIMYIFAALSAAYGIWSINYCNGVIKEAMSYGQVSIENDLYTIINFYVSYCAQYIIFALLLFAAGVLLQKTRGLTSGVSVAGSVGDGSDVDKESDDEFYEEPDDEELDEEKLEAPYEELEEELLEAPNEELDEELGETQE